MIANTVMLLERGIREISRVLVLTRNSVYSVRLVEDAIPHVYKMEGAPIVSRESFNFIIMKAIFGCFFQLKNVISYENKTDTTV